MEHAKERHTPTNGGKPSNIKKYIYSMSEGSSRALPSVCSPASSFGLVVPTVSSTGVLLDAVGLRAYVRQLHACRVEHESVWSYWCRRLGFGKVSVEDTSAVLRALSRVGYPSDGLNKHDLAQFGHPLSDALANYRAAGTLLSSADALMRSADPNGVVRAQYRSAITGRLQTYEFALQNLARELRRYIVASPGMVLVNVDLTAQEFVVLAKLSGDPDLLEAIGVGADPHRTMAAVLFGVEESEVDADLRSRAKPINLGVLYGKSVPTLADDLGCSWADAADAVGRWKEAFPHAAKYLDDAGQSAAKTYEAVSPLGHRHHYDRDTSKNEVRRSGRNFPIQSHAAEVFQERLVALYDLLAANSWGQIVLLIHDCYLLEVPEAIVHWAEDPIRQLLQNSPLLGLPQPVRLGVGRTWFDAQENAV